CTRTLPVRRTGSPISKSCTSTSPSALAPSCGPENRTLTGASKHDELWARAEALLPVLRERAPRSEELRRIPEETLRDFHAAELFRIHQPKRVGGAELDFVA